MNFLLSSYDFHESWGETIFSKVITPEMKVCVIPFSFESWKVKCAEDFDKEYGPDGVHTPWIYRPFHHYGIKDEKITFIDYFRDSHYIAKQKVLDADILFLTGGLPDEYLVRLKEFGLDDLIRLGNYIVIGASAGALIQLTNYHINPDDDYLEFMYLDGLGLLDGFEISCHYNHYPSQEYGIHRVLEERDFPVYTIANDGGLYVNGDEIIMMGNCHKLTK